MWVTVLSEALWLAKEKLQRQEMFPGMRRTPGCVHGQNASDSHLSLVKISPKPRFTTTQVGGSTESPAKSTIFPVQF